VESSEPFQNLMIGRGRGLGCSDLGLEVWRKVIVLTLKIQVLCRVKGLGFRI
jgi:hypothetical protein